MSYDEDQETFEHTLLVVREVSVFKIPPRPTSGGYKCGEWLQSDKIWSGRLRVVSCDTRCEIRLEDPNSGELFAACFVNPGQREVAVESVLDSSRYFVLRVEDGRGKHAFLGLGFNERNEAFDFNVALSDHEKYVKREVDKEVGAGGEGGEDGQIDIHPAVNHRLKVVVGIYLVAEPQSGIGSITLFPEHDAIKLEELSGNNDEFIPGSRYDQVLKLISTPMKLSFCLLLLFTLEGETIRISVKNKPSSGTGMLSAAGLSSGTGKPKALSLAPPPSGAVKIRSPLPPPPNDAAVARITSSSHGTALKGAKENSRPSSDTLSDFSQLEKNLPSTAGSGSPQTSAAGWAAF
ncbi:hypothetical protein DH2020_001312 [Rehmannia glutinosa]|uniref:NECAP PHear domain-containing protein n=1 Tax=Rehmannia glutinosa TaxID=99300 RepID=A0ABR0XZ57_REHGL